MNWIIRYWLEKAKWMFKNAKKYDYKLKFLIYWLIPESSL